MTASSHQTIPAGLTVSDTEVDLLVVGSGTGLAAALAACEQGLSTLVIEKSAVVGGSTARSGGALWLPASPVIAEGGGNDPSARADTYLRAVVGDSAPESRSAAYLEQLPATIDMLRRTTPMKLFWAKEYSDYHPEAPGGSAAGRTCECRPLDTTMLGQYRSALRPGIMEVSIPMPTTGADYRWLNLVSRVPRKGIPTIAKRLAQGIGGLLLGRRYAAGGQALAAGLFAGAISAGIPIWLHTSLTSLTTDGDRITGAVIEHQATPTPWRHGAVWCLPPAGSTTTWTCGTSSSRKALAPISVWVRTPTPGTPSVSARRPARTSP